MTTPIGHGHIYWYFYDDVHGQSGAVTFDDQIKSLEIITNANKGESVEVLSGDTVETAATYTHALKVEAYQDLTPTGLLATLWRHIGEVVKVSTYPNSDAVDGAPGFWGRVRIDPAAIGGDVGKANTTTITLPYVEFKQDYRSSSSG